MVGTRFYLIDIRGVSILADATKKETLIEKAQKGTVTSHTEP